MRFSHAPDLWHRFPTLRAGVVAASGLDENADVSVLVAHHLDIARTRLAAGPESDLPAIQAWRRAFSALGLKPTQYRCAAESLLRRLRKEGTLPTLHPLVDLCNAISVAYAVPIAVLDRRRITGDLEVRFATGSECFEAFDGAVEHPDAGEVTFVDAGGRAHARRWTHRQSGYSSVRAETGEVLIVMEALHETAGSDVQAVRDAVRQGLESAWRIDASAALLTAQSPTFDA